MRIIFCLLFACITLYPAQAQAVYLKLADYNGKTDWIIGTASGKATFDESERAEVDTLPDTFDLRHPARHDTAWRYVSGEVKSDTTGATTVPEPKEAKTWLFKKARNDWGFTASDMRSLIRDYALLQYIEGDNYDMAKIEVEAMTETALVNDTQARTTKKYLDGKL